MSANISDSFTQQLQQMRSELIEQIRSQRGGKIGRAEAAGDRLRREALAAALHAEQQYAARRIERGARFAEHFKQADTDHDGKLTLAEAQAGMPRLAKIFAQIDVKKQGYLTQDDIRTFMAAHRRGPRGADQSRPM